MVRYTGRSLYRDSTVCIVVKSLLFDNYVSGTDLCNWLVQNCNIEDRGESFLPFDDVGMVKSRVCTVQPWNQTGSLS